MKLKNILTAAACVILCFALLTGCTAQKDDEGVESTKGFSAENKEEAAEKKNDNVEIEPAELTYLRAKIKENESSVGVAYIDFVPDIEAVKDHNYASDFSTNGIFKEYPFFYEYPVSVKTGSQMFAVVPANVNSEIKVYKVNVDDEGELHVDRNTVLYEDKAGKPFILLCNDHEAYSNVLISVKDGDKTVEFSPSVSLENGRDLILENGCYDFTVNDVRAYSDEVREYLVENIDEIKEGVENGMTLRSREGVFMCNHYTIKFELGKYDEDYNFIVAREYLVDEYYTLAFYEPEDGEQTIGWRVVGNGFEYNQAKG